jgi:hypothetical protein
MKSSVVYLGEVLLLSLFANSVSVYAFAQASNQQQQQAPAITQRQNLTTTQQAMLNLTSQRQTMKVKSLRDLRKASLVGWQVVDLNCEDATSNACAQAAIAEVNLECGESSSFFRKGSVTWTWINFGMIVGSSIFTALGASTTLANAKVFSTLGASTALGAVATTATTNSTADQGGLLAIASNLDAFLKFIQTGGDSSKPADNDLIYKSAPVYAAKCVAAAASSGGH